MCIDINSIGVIVTAAATTALALFTRKYVKLTNGLLEETRSPSVYVDLEIGDYQLVKLVLGNVGNSPAFGVAIASEDSLPWRQEHHRTGFKSIEVVENGLGYLAPGRVLKYSAGYLEDISSIDHHNGIVKFTISFNTYDGRYFKTEAQIDFCSYSQALYESFINPSMQISKAILDVSKEVRQLKRSSPFDSLGTRRCPMCNERISDKAKKCPKCLEFIDKETSEHQTQS